jgi:outer membrane protein TolC
MVKKLYVFIFLISISLFSSGQENLTLDKCRARVIEYNPTLKQQEKLVESAEANIQAKKKDYFPTIDVNGDYTFLQNPIILETSPNPTEGPQNIYGLDAPIIQNVYRGSLVRRSNELAGLQKEYASNSKDNIENFLLLETERAFWNAVYNEELLQLIVNYRVVIDDLAAVIRDKVEAEIISRNDLLLVEVRQNEAELFGLMATNQLDVSIMELNRMIGYPLDQKHQLQGNLDEVLVSSIDYSLDAVLNNRPDIAAQNKNVEMQKTNAELVKSQYLPSVYAGIIPSWGVPNTNLGATDPNYNTAFLAGLNIPITRWGKRKQDVGRELLLAEAAAYELKELQDEVKLDINSSSYQLAESIRRIELTKESLQKADENLSIMTDRYLEGLTSILEVLDAQEFWQRAYKDLLDAQVYYKRAFAYYKHSIDQI